MSKVQIAGSKLLLDPDVVTKLEVRSDKIEGATVRIWSQDRAKPQRAHFTTKKAAIEFCSRLWGQRTLDDDEGVEFRVFRETVDVGYP